MQSEGSKSQPVQQAQDLAQEREIKRIKAGLGLMLNHITLPESTDGNAARNAYVKQEINNLIERAKYYFNNKSSKEYMQLCITTLQKLRDQIPGLLISDKHNKLHKLISRFDAIAEREARIAKVAGELSDSALGNANLVKLRAHIANMQVEGFLRYVGTATAGADKLENAAWFTDLSAPEQSYFKKIRDELNALKNPEIISAENAIHYLRAIQAFDSSYTCTIMPSNLYIEDAKSAGYFAGAFGAVSEANTAATMPVARIGLISNGGDDFTASSKVRQLLLTYATNLFAAKYTAGTEKVELHISFSSYLDALNLPGFPSDAKYEKLVAAITTDETFITKLTASCKRITGMDDDQDVTITLTHSFNRYPINATREYMTPANRISYKEANAAFVELYRKKIKNMSDGDDKTYLGNLLKEYETLNNNIYSSGKGFVAWCGALQGEGKHNKQAVLAVLHQLIVDQFNDGSVRNCKSSKDRTGLVAILLERAKQWKKLYPEAGLPKFIQEACGTWDAKQEAAYNLVPKEKQQDSYPFAKSELIAQAEQDIGDKAELNKIYESAKGSLAPKDVDALITCVEYKKQTSTTGHALKDSQNQFNKSKGLAVGAILAGTIGFGVTAAVIGGLTSVNAVERLWHTSASAKEGFWGKGFGKFLATTAKIVATPFVAVAGFVAGATVGTGAMVVSAAKSLGKPTTYQTTPDMQAHLSDPEFSKINSSKVVASGEGQDRRATNFKELKHDSKRSKHKGQESSGDKSVREKTKQQNIAAGPKAIVDAYFNAEIKDVVAGRKLRAKQQPQSQPLSDHNNSAVEVDNSRATSRSASPTPGVRSHSNSLSSTASSSSAALSGSVTNAGVLSNANGNKNAASSNDSCGLFDGGQQLNSRSLHSAPLNP
jgi:hypothetical protein